MSNFYCNCIYDGTIHRKASELCASLNAHDVLGSLRAMRKFTAGRLCVLAATWTDRQ